MSRSSPSNCSGLSGIKHLLGTEEFQAGYQAGSNSEHYLAAQMPPENELAPPYDDLERNKIWLTGYRVAVQ